MRGGPSNVPYISPDKIKYQVREPDPAPGLISLWGKTARDGKNSDKGNLSG